MLTVTNLTSVDYLMRNLPSPDATMLGDIIAETIEVVNDVAEVPYTEDELRGFTLIGFEDFLADQINEHSTLGFHDHEDENVIRYERFVEILERLTYRDPSEIDWD
tara:strand:+ start:48 stop:365 length:318 start_codon:yes stop_codon:yes gene_type:complete